MESSRVGPYELQRPLGAGGMAETFVAVRRGPAGFEQSVCLKRILPGRAADAAFVELFLDEARLLAKLRNAAIVQVHDFGEADGTYYMALELVDGMDLEVLLNALRRQRKRLPWSLCLYIASQILSALHYAHGVVIDGQPLGLVHRDISPSNVLLSTQGEVKLTDFGIAKAQGRQHKTATGHTKGKVAYMSPEQVRGEELDSRSDLFAVGVVLYEMLAGVHPFDAPTDLTLLNNILSGTCVPLSERLPGLPEPVQQLVRKLLAVSAAQRFSSPGEALMAVSVVDQPFVLQNQLAALVSELRPARPEPKRRSSGSANDGSTQVLPQARTSGSQPATPAKGTSDVNLRRRRSPLLWVTIVGGAVFLGGLVAFGVWSNGQTKAPPAPPQAAQNVPSLAAPAAQAFDEPAELVAPPMPADAPRPSGSALETDNAEPPSSTGLILHRPGGGGGERKPAADPSPARRSVPRRAASKGEPTSAEDAARKLKARSGASVSVDDF